MGGTVGHSLAENFEGEKRQMPGCPVAFALAKSVSLDILRKFEQSPLAGCQYSEYLTLLSSFPDVKKSV
jgi:hypothetical protein